MTQQDKEKQPESAETTPTRFVHVREVRFAYRRFGNPAGTPLILLQHFRGSMDNWDPALLNGFAKDRTVITFDNAGVGFSKRGSARQRGCHGAGRAGLPRRAQAHAGRSAQLLLGGLYRAAPDVEPPPVGSLSRRHFYVSGW